MKNAVFWDIKTQFVPHRKHYFSAKVSSQLMLCKFWRFHGSDYEEYRLLGYTKPVLTSEETHYSPLQSQAGLCYVRFEVFTAVTRKNVVFWDVTQCDSCKNFVPISLILVIFMMEVLPCSETSVLTRATQRNIPDEGIIHCTRLVSYFTLHISSYPIFRDPWPSLVFVTRWTEMGRNMYWQAKCQPYQQFLWEINWFIVAGSWLLI
jgi:hypothetical protein